MSTETWSPQNKPSKPTEISQQWLKQFIQYSENNQLEKMDALIPSEEQKIISGLMQLGLDSWRPAVNTYTDEQIIHLIRFFTLTETRLPDCEAGDKSPVISLAKVLKSRGLRIEKDLLLWIRANSNNRFLPHGSIL